MARAIWALWLSLVVYATLSSAQGSPQSEVKCPGVLNGLCGPECQVYLCKSLAAFYKVTRNVSDPWDNEEGWELTAERSCEDLVAQSPTEAIYCNWFGIGCCHADSIAAGNCSAEDTVYSIRLPINNLNASVGNPNVLEPLQQLHGCGLHILDLEANNLVGQMSDLWGDLFHLRLLNLGNCWIEGTIPNTLRQLRNVTFVNLSNNWLNGTLPPWIDDLQGLEVLNLGSQFGQNEGTDQVGLLGTIPVQIGRLWGLRELNLEMNALTGTLPPNLCSGDDSKLMLFNVRANRLAGNATVVESCGNLIELDIGDNSFTGRLPATPDWDELSSYRAGRNKFTGTVPVELTTHARILEYLDISYNQLSGSFPNQITILSALKAIDISGNQFTGTLTEDVWYLPALTMIALGNNQFVGTIPPAIGLAYSLQLADFSNNPGLTGFIPPQLGLVESLQSVRISNTSLSCGGIIQPYTITTNSSCSDPEQCRTPKTFGDNSTRRHVCSPDEQLPCFLKFSDYLVPRDDDSNMRCKVILRMAQEESVQACGGHSRNQLGQQDSLIPKLSAFTYQQTWFVDPGYYQYQACECLVGYTPVWNETVLKCVLADDPGFATYKRTAVIVGSVAAAAVLIAAVIVWRQYLATRPAWLRERLMQQKRMKGAPKCLKPGDKVSVSIVVTDVKDFSELTRRCPELMNKAMGGHNNILRKACHAHAGYVMDQEGDSWTVAFHDAEDAVGFSLQVQQALAHKVWGLRLATSDAALQDLRNLSSRDEGFSTKYSMVQASQPSTQVVDLHTCQSRESSCNAAIDPAAQAASLQQVILHGEAGLHDIRGARVGSSFTSSIWHGPASSSSSLSDLNQLAQANGSGSERALRRNSTVLEQLFTNKDPSRTPGAEQNGEVRTSFSDTKGSRDADTPQHSQPALQLQPSGASLDSAVHVQQGPFGSRSSAGTVGSIIRPNDERQRSSGGSKFWGAGVNIVRRFSAFTKSGSSYTKGGVLGSDQQPLQLLKLAIRIGVATGPLPYGTDVGNCAVKDKAKEYISDVANAGQVLIDEATFLQVKDSLSVLGTLNENGYDDRALTKLMHAQLVDKLHNQIACGSCIRIPREMSFSSDSLMVDAQDYDNDAIVVHMGCFELPVWSLVEDSPNGRSSPVQSHSTELVIDNGKDCSVTQLENASPGKDRRPSAFMNAVRKEQLQLYSVAAPGMRKPPDNTQDLVHYKGWCESVNARPGWVQVQKGYFDAPGARQMQLMPCNSSYTGSQSPLPDVTIVFASIANAASYAMKRSRSEIKYLNKAIRCCMMQQLAALPGSDGYLCRCQQGDLKYMVAFEQPQRAVQWCLAVQEALMYVGWPAHVLAHPGFEEVLDPSTGMPLFRGPRLRMGLAEGQPNSVLPDHTGRANYYGGSVNRAARYADVAAHGGQVVLDVELVRKVCSIWAAEGAGLMQAHAETVEHLPSAASGVAAPVTPQQSVTGQQQPLPVVNGRRHQQLLRSLSNSNSRGSAPAGAPQAAAKDVGADPAVFLQPAVRCNSETLQEVTRRNRDHHVTFSFSFGTRSAQQQQQLIDDIRCLSVTAAGLGPCPSALADLPELASAGAAVPGPGGSSLEPIVATHIGSFAFKGSGQSDMASVLHHSIAHRTYPEEPPKGKGERLGVRVGPVEDLDDVLFRVPAPLLAARQLFRTMEMLWSSGVSHD